MERKVFEFQIENSRRDKLSVALEPWGEVKEIRPGGTIRLKVEGPVSEDPSRVMVVRVEDRNRMSVWGWTDSSIEDVSH